MWKRSVELSRYAVGGAMGEFEQMVLLAILHLEGEVYGIGQLALGTFLGLGFGILGLGEELFAQGPGPIMGIAALILIMGLIACGRPVSRALRIQPTEALREGG